MEIFIRGFNVESKNKARPNLFRHMVNVISLLKVLWNQIHTVSDDLLLYVPKYSYPMDPSELDLLANQYVISECCYLILKIN